MPHWRYATASGQLRKGQKDYYRLWPQLVPQDSAKTLLAPLFNFKVFKGIVGAPCTEQHFVQQCT
jgi:hypothetical protein